MFISISRLSSFLVFFLVVFYQQGVGAQGPDLLYIEFNKKEVELGKLERSGSFIEQNIILRQFPIQNIPVEKDSFVLDALFVSILEQAVERGKKVLIYTHSWLGEIEPYFSPSVKAIANEILPDSNWIILALLRPTSLSGYKRNHAEAYVTGVNAGRFLEPVMDILHPHKEKCYLIAHSMGNRFLEGMSETWADNQFFFKHLILAAPDIDIPVIQLLSSKNIAQQITVYIHTDDRVLTISSLFLGKPRLGNQHLPVFQEEDSSVHYVDVTNAAYTWEHIDLSNHVYFISASKVRADIRSILKEESPDSRIQLSGNTFWLDKNSINQNGVE